jgi:hypothetical protein
MKKGIKKSDIDTRFSLSIEEFCLIEGFSTAVYYAMRKRGDAPTELRIPKTSKIKITPEARAEWHKRMQSREVQAQTEREFERRSEYLKLAGKKAAESDKHISQKRRAARLEREGAQKPAKKKQPPLQAAE